MIVLNFKALKDTNTNYSNVVCHTLTVCDCCCCCCYCWSEWFSCLSSWFHSIIIRYSNLWSQMFVVVIFYFFRYNTLRWWQLWLSLFLLRWHFADIFCLNLKIHLEYHWFSISFCCAYDIFSFKLGFFSSFFFHGTNFFCCYEYLSISFLYNFVVVMFDGWWTNQFFSLFQSLNPCVKCCKTINLWLRLINLIMSRCCWVDIKHESWIMEDHVWIYFVLCCGRTSYKSPTLHWWLIFVSLKKMLDDYFYGYVLCS